MDFRIRKAHLFINANYQYHIKHYIFWIGSECYFRTHRRSFFNELQEEEYNIKIRLTQKEMPLRAMVFINFSDVIRRTVDHKPSTSDPLVSSVGPLNINILLHFASCHSNFPATFLTLSVQQLRAAIYLSSVVCCKCSKLKPIMT